jgi:hypothetical protein
MLRYQVFQHCMKIWQASALIWIAFFWRKYNITKLVQTRQQLLGDNFILKSQ